MNKKNKRKKILILTGSGGSGKTTIADLLVKSCGFIKVDGENIDAEFFPNGCQWLSENSKKLKIAHEKIFEKVKDLFNSSEKSIVLDYIIFGNYLEFLEKFRKEFGENLEIKVLFPSEEETVKRDRERECWTTGIERISSVRAELQAIKNIIGESNFINTTCQTPDDTLKKYFSNYCQHNNNLKKK